MTHARQSGCVAALVTATPEQLAAVRSKFERTREDVMAGGDADPWVLFPKWKAALDALPDLTPSLALAPEFRIPLLDMLVQAGATFPDGFRGSR